MEALRFKEKQKALFDIWNIFLGVEDYNNRVKSLVFNPLQLMK